MAIGKNKRLSKGKKASKKKVVDSFAKKEWYDLRAPQCFTNPRVGKTVVNRSTGIRAAADGLRGRVVEINLQDIHQTQASHKQFKLVVAEVAGRACLTTFHGMRVTTDRLWTSIRRGATLIEAVADATTLDGHLLRVFALCLSASTPGQIRKNCRAKTSHVRRVRAKMVEHLRDSISRLNIVQVMERLTNDGLAHEMEAKCRTVRPVKDFLIRKVKVLKAPKMDLAKLLEMHGESKLSDIGAGDEGAPIAQEVARESFEAPVEAQS